MLARKGSGERDLGRQFLLEARSQLLVASHLAGVGQASGTGVGLVHALGHALGTRGKLPHGTALAVVLPDPTSRILTRELLYTAVTRARERLLATYDHGLTTHEWATGYRWDIVLTGRHGTPMEQEDA